MNKSLLCVLLASSSILLACKNQTQTPQNTTSPVIENNVQLKDIPFVVAERYFVNNSVTDIDSPKITTQEDFEKIFGMATVMGENGRPTQIDFSKQFVIALIKPETNRPTELTAVSLQMNTENELLFAYKSKIGEPQEYTIRPCLVIVVDKKNDGMIVLREL
ncbi:MAG: hypothetical protein Q4G08_01675 [Capnocytophaga sp.]|nr:hypothetical protein [Capnocytophaga sp.]